MGFASNKPVRAMAIVLTILVLVVVLVRVFLPVEKIRDLALDQARSRLGREVSVGEVSVSLVGGLGVRMADFAVHNPPDWEGGHLVTTRALDLKLEIGPLLKGEMRVDRLVIEGPTLNLVRQADGRDNFTFGTTETVSEQPGAGPADPTIPAASSTAPPPLSIASLKLQDSQVIFSDGTKAETGMHQVDLSGLDLGLTLVDLEPGRFRSMGKLSAARVVLSGPTELPELAIDSDFDLVWDAPSSRLDLKSLALAINDLPLTVSGFLETGQAKPMGKVQIQALDLSLSQLAAFMPPSPKGNLAGLCDLTLEVVDNTGDPAQITYTGHLTAKDVSFTGSDLVDELEDLDADVEFTQDKFTVESCQARFASGSLELTGSLHDPFPFFLPSEMQGSAPIKTPHLDFKLYCPRLDVDRLLPAASPATSATMPGGTEPSEPRLVVPSDLEFPALSCNGSFRADTLIYMQVPLTEVTGQIKLRDRQLSIFDVEGAVYQGNVNGQMDIDLNDLNDPVYQGEYQAHDIEVDNFVTRFAGLAGTVFGGCNLSGGFTARGIDPVSIRNSLTLDANAGISRGRVVTSGNLHATLNNLAQKTGASLDKEQGLKDLTTHISVRNGQVTMNELKTRLGQFGDITVDGFYGFNGDINYQGKLILTRAQTDRLFNGNQVLREAGKLLGSERPEQLELPLTLSGTRLSPSLKLDLGSVTSDLQERALKAQGRKLEDKAKSELEGLFKKLK